MTTANLINFALNNDFGYANNTGAFGAICDNDARALVAATLGNSNTPEALEGEALADVVANHPEFEAELANGCTIYAAAEYDGANHIDTHYIAYYEA